MTAAAAAPTFEVFTLFPAAISGFLRAGLVGKAVESGRVAVHCTDYREFATDRYRTVDDAPYGGGPGMVMKIEPVVAALEHVEAQRGPMHRVLLTPSGARFDQRAAERLSKLPRIGLLCGRYEGIDDRVRDGFVDECLSLGDFVLNGGEIAALAIVEAVARLCEGVLGNPESAARDSFALEDMSHGPWLEFPQYTRPPNFRGLAVPPVLLAGDHAEIARWRLLQAWRRTWALRPDLRPPRRRPAGAPLYVALLCGHARTGMLEQASAALAPLAAAAGAQIVTVGPRAGARSLKELRRTLRRAHGPTPRFVGLGAPAGDLPVAASTPALLDLLASTGEGDLSAPLILVVSLPAAPAGDLTRSTPQEPQDPSLAAEKPPELVEAVFAPTPTPSSGLAQTPVMAESSGPQARQVALLAQALAELTSARSTTLSELRHEQQQPVD